MDDIFNLDPSKIIKKTEMKKFEADPNIYAPKVEKGGKYIATIKFLPNQFNTEENIVKLNTTFLHNLKTDKKRVVHCPSTIGEKSIIRQVYTELYNSDNVADKELANSFRRKTLGYSLVQIIEDNQNPDLVGQIKVYQFPINIYKMIENIINDEDEPNNPFDIFEGRSLKLRIEYSNSPGAFWDYSKSTWKMKPDLMLDENGEPTEDRRAIKKIFENNKIDISQYGYKPWDDETKQFVKETIISTLPSGAKISKMLKENGMENETANTSKSKQARTDFEDEDDDILVSKSSSNKMYNETKISNSKSKPTISSDDIDDDDIDELITKSKPKKNINVAALIDDEDDE